MPIEFRCHRCQKLLRTPDNTAGKQAQCPQCGEVQTIPTPPPPVPPPAAPVVPPPTVGPSPFRSGAAAPAVNPYQSPLAGAGASPIPPAPTARSGPPWERNGPSFATFWETARDTLFSAPRLFAHLRREGGLGRPAGFLLAGSLLGVLAALAQIFALLLIGVTAGEQQPNEPAMAMLGYVIIAGCAVGFGPLLALAGTFIYAAVYHSLLSIMGGANFPFEATFRVVAYSHGAAYLLYLIPCCGPQISNLAVLGLAIIGLAQVHETTGWKAAGAVLPPAVLCCGMQIAAWTLSQLGA